MPAMDDVLGARFPWVLRRAWRRSDPAQRAERTCDALGELTLHQPIQTHRGRYWICSRTGQLVRDDFPSVGDLVEHYDDRWTDRIRPELSEAEHKAVAKWKVWLRRFEAYREGGRLLEIGSGKGELLRAAVEAGWQAEGNELSPVGARHAEQFSGAPVHVGSIEDIALTAERYDVVLLNNVFEHLRSPSGVLQSVAAATRPGGVVFVQTLCAQSLSMWLNPEAWAYFGTGHLHIPTLASFTAYCERAGLTVLSVRTHGFRSMPGGEHSGGRGVRRRIDKLVAAAAARARLGHRLEALLGKPQ
jgi:2-polyprenyl-3-methyl-5-hydroxy-6-metoxy-1,4-benzoquinol methylase